MKRAVLTLALAGHLGGCVTGAAFVKPHEVSLPVLIGATVADLVVVGLISSQASGFTVGATIATTLAVTAADVGVGCILGACAALRP